MKMHKENSLRSWYKTYLEDFNSGKIVASTKTTTLNNEVTTTRVCET